VIVDAELQGQRSYVVNVRRHSLAFGVHCSVFKKRFPDERARTVRSDRSDTRSSGIAHRRLLGSGARARGNVGVNGLARRNPTGNRVRGDV